MDEDFSKIENIAEILELCKDELENNGTEVKAVLDFEDLESLKILYNLCKKEIDENIKLKEKIEQIKKEIINFDNSCKKTLKTYDTLTNDNFKFAYMIIKKIEDLIER